MPFREQREWRLGEIPERQPQPAKKARRIIKRKEISPKKRELRALDNVLHG